MSRPRSHDTDELANRIFKSLLPPNWQPRQQTPDYRIDYLVEIFENQESTGLTFAVQLKGTRSLKRSRDAVSFRVQTEHLIYYVERVQSPLFLIVVDVPRKSGYWLFLQAYALEKLEGKAWREQNTVTVRIPIDNDLSSTLRFRSAIDTATKRMAELHPAAITGAISAEEKRMESIDPRFNVLIQATEKGVHYTVNPRLPVAGKITLKGESAVKKGEDLFFLGQPITLGPGEVEFTGMPLFARIMKEGGTIHWARKAEANDGSRKAKAYGRHRHGTGYDERGRSTEQCATGKPRLR